MEENDPPLLSINYDDHVTGLAFLVDDMGHDLHLTDDHLRLLLSDEFREKVRVVLRQMTGGS